MASFRLGIVGASGYSGAVASRLVLAHPHLKLAFCTSDKWAKQSVRSIFGGESLVPTFVPNAEAAELTSHCDSVMLATSAEVSMELAPRFLDMGIDVIDLSGAFRLREPRHFETWYRLEHRHPDLLRAAHYGLVELYPIPLHDPARPRLIANPGCYATAASLALAPLMKAGLLQGPIFVDGKSGVSGAGRSAAEAYSFTEVSEDLRAYKILEHQHTPEMRMVLADAAGIGLEEVDLTFTPHLIPIKRGLLVTAYASTSVDGQDLAVCLRNAYAGCRFVEVVPPGEVTLNSVVGTNQVRVGAAASRGRAVVTASLDNLLKGAGGQAIQGLNVALSFDEGAGLSHLQRYAP